MARSWNHRVFRLAAQVVDRYDRFGTTCASGRCQHLPTHATWWNYVTGRRGRVSDTTRHVCTEHGERFARTHGLTVGDPQPQQAAPVAAAMAAMTGGPIHQVRVHRVRGAQWYLQERRAGTDLLATSNRWLAGVGGDASLDLAIAEAETLLARTHRLVPAESWRVDAGEATAAVIPAQRHDAWFEQPWRLTVSCDDTGMWTLARVLDNRFGPLTDDLGNHRMDLDRALQVATDLLAEQRWVPCADPAWTVYADDTAAQDAWHPDQARPDLWRPAPAEHDHTHGSGAAPTLAGIRA